MVQEGGGFEKPRYTDDSSDLLQLQKAQAQHGSAWDRQNESRRASSNCTQPRFTVNPRTPTHLKADDRHAAALPMQKRCLE